MSDTLDWNAKTIAEFRATASSSAAATTRAPCWPRWPHKPLCPYAVQNQADPAGGHRRRMRRLPGDQPT